MQCLECNTETTNPKFCSQSCAAIYNNRTNPNTQPKGQCFVCKTPISKRHKYCEDCRKELLIKKAKFCARCNTSILPKSTYCSDCYREVSKEQAKLKKTKKHTTLIGTGLHSKEKGNIGEMSVAHRLTLEGFNVFKELGDLSKIDLIAEKNNICIRIQCKCVVPKNGAVQLHFVKNGPNYSFKYDKTMLDFFAVCRLDTLEIAFVSSAILDEYLTSVSLRTEQPKKITGGSNMFSDFTSIDSLNEFVLSRTK